MIAGIGFDSEHMAFTSRMILNCGEASCPDKLDGLRGSIDEVGLRRGKRLEANNHPALLRAGDRVPEGRRRPLPGLGAGNARQHVALLRRADDHHFAAEVSAEVNQLAEVLAVRSRRLWSG